MAGSNTFTFGEDSIEKWEDLYRLVEKYCKLTDPDKQWIFRAESSDKDLKSSLEVKLEGIIKDRTKYLEMEEKLIVEFMRRAHQYGFQLPLPHEREYWLEWLAVMRHFDAPTRLLDFSYSLYVVFYFAINTWRDGGKPVIWAVNAKNISIVKECEYKSGRYMSKWEKVRILWRKLLDSPKHRVYTLNSYYLNPRQTIQQGLFMMPGDLRETFDSNIQNTFTLGLLEDGDIVKIRIKMNENKKEEWLLKLNDMNINQATLFPDLGGFAEYLGKTGVYLAKHK
ncbi:FRG domain-containing protein [bacterium]|nr:FRG domain-containing protein [candidate division CSSED10-310 bacterium]